MKGWQKHTRIPSLVCWCKPMFWKLKPPVKAPYSKHLWKSVFHTHIHTHTHTHTHTHLCSQTHTLRVLRNANAWRTQVLYNNSPSVTRLLLLFTYLWLFCCFSCQISLHILSQIMTGPLSMNYRVRQDYAIMSTLFPPRQAANGWGVITGSSSTSLGYTQTHTGCDLTLLGGAAG